MYRLSGIEKENCRKGNHKYLLLPDVMKEILKYV